MSQSDGSAFVDGMIATMDNQSSDAAPRASGKKGMSIAQKMHILKVRKVVETTRDMRVYDWRNMLFQQTSGCCTPHAYYVKPSAAWVPHLIKRGFHPYCSMCEQPVPTIDFRWVEQPMILFGVTGHRYLDTVRYKCARCNSSFRGTNMHSLSLDKTGFVSLTFQVHLLKRCAVDEELYRQVTSSIMEPTSSIVHSLKEQTI